mmetsp:Transcript_13403/g.35162  ORF Transcript_13403/g.35162 Transcript_13403/m.35162 type:complete len:544 (-) Transcript_13403:648-2279(-)
MAEETPKMRDRQERRSYAVGDQVELEEEDAWLIPQYNSEEADHNIRERGVVRSIKPSYGFVRSIERDDRLFYHITEYQVEGDSLVPGDCVEFTVVKNHVSSQLNAVRIEKLPKGSVVFEEFSDMEERGHIDYVKSRPPKPERIYEDVYGYVKPIGGGESLPFRYEDVDGQSLGKGDLVLFTMAVDKRSKEKAARKIKLLERKSADDVEGGDELENLEAQKRYSGVVKSLKDTFGFVFCPEREERLFFHISEVQNMNQVLKPGAEVEFSVRWNEANKSRNAVEVVVVGRGGATSSISPPDARASRQSGVVCSVKSTYGFIRYHGVRMRPRVASDSRAMSREREVYFRNTDVKEGGPAEVGDEVEFNVEVNRRTGERCATEVKVMLKNARQEVRSPAPGATAMRPRIASDQVYVRPRAASIDKGESPADKGLAVIMARGPDGSRGFGAGRGKVVPGQAPGTPVHTPDARSPSSGDRGAKGVSIRRRDRSDSGFGGTPPRAPVKGDTPKHAPPPHPRAKDERGRGGNDQRGRGRGRGVMRSRHQSA